MNTLSPDKTIFAAFSELGMRAFTFFCYFLSGAFIGFISAAINHVIVGNKAEVTDPTVEWQDEPIGYLDFTMSIHTALGIIGIGLVILGMVRMIRGTKTIFFPALVAIGSSLAIVLWTSQNGWQSSILTLVLIAIFITTGLIFRNRALRNKELVWEREIAAIHEENRLRRQENMELEEGSDEENEESEENHEEEEEPLSPEAMAAILKISGKE